MFNKSGSKFWRIYQCHVYCTQRVWSRANIADFPTASSHLTDRCKSLCTLLLLPIEAFNNENSPCVTYVLFWLDIFVFFISLWCWRVPDLKAWCAQLEKGEIHVLARMIQLLHKTRKQLTVDVLRKLILVQLTAPSYIKEQLISWMAASTTVACPAVPIISQQVGCINQHKENTFVISKIDFCLSSAWYFIVSNFL